MGDPEPIVTVAVEPFDGEVAHRLIPASTPTSSERYADDVDLEGEPRPGHAQRPDTTPSWPRSALLVARLDGEPSRLRRPATGAHRRAGHRRGEADVRRPRGPGPGISRRILDDP